MEVRKDFLPLNIIVKCNYRQVRGHQVSKRCPIAVDLDGLAGLQSSTSALGAFGQSRAHLPTGLGCPIFQDSPLPPLFTVLISALSASGFPAQAGFFVICCHFSPSRPFQDRLADTAPTLPRSGPAKLRPDKFPLQEVENVLLSRAI